MGARHDLRDNDFGDAEARFWSYAEPLLVAPSVTRSTMMGFPCLRVSGRFFASFDQRTGALVAKLPAGRVDELLSSGQAEPFAPAGRRFREWAAIGGAQQHLWPGFLNEAHAFARDGS
jgi:hypothetical protein